MAEKGLQREYSLVRRDSMVMENFIARASHVKEVASDGLAFGLACHCLKTIDEFKMVRPMLEAANLNGLLGIFSGGIGMLVDGAEDALSGKHVCDSCGTDFAG